MKWQPIYHLKQGIRILSICLEMEEVHFMVKIQFPLNLKVYKFFVIGKLHTDESWTHNLKFHPTLTMRGGAIWATVH